MRQMRYHSKFHHPHIKKIVLIMVLVLCFIKMGYCSSNSSRSKLDSFWKINSDSTKSNKDDDQIPFHYKPRNSTLDPNSSIKVAGCMSGGIRTLFDENIQQIIKFQLIQSLEMDLFMYVGFEPIFVNWTLFSSLQEMNDTFHNSIIKNLQPISFGTYSLRDDMYPPKDEWKEKAPCWLLKKRGTRPHKNWNQFRAVQECYNLILDHEKKNNFKYDWIIRMRPDVIYSFLPPKNNPFNPKFQITLPILPPNQTVASLTNIWGQKVWNERFFCDHFQIVPRSVSDVHFSVERNVRFCNASVSKIVNKEGLLDRKWPREDSCYWPECLWTKQLEEYGFSVNKSINYNIMLVGHHRKKTQKEKYLYDRNIVHVRKRCPWKDKSLLPWQVEKLKKEEEEEKERLYNNQTSGEELKIYNQTNEEEMKIYNQTTEDLEEDPIT